VEGRQLGATGDVQKGKIMIPLSLAVLLIPFSWDRLQEKYNFGHQISYCGRNENAIKICGKSGIQRPEAIGKKPTGMSLWLKRKAGRKGTVKKE
jgi:hypothetical protein